MKKKPISWMSKGRSIVLLGLDFAGKTTFVKQWTKNVFDKTSTTIGMDIEHIEMKGETFNLLDLGGQEPFRVTLWKTYAQMSQGAIFVFDITDRKRLQEAVKWFWIVETWLKEDVPIIFCANKIDLRNDPNVETLSLEEIIEIFEFKNFSQAISNLHSFRIFEISAKTGENVDEAMQWIFSKVVGSKEKAKVRHVLLFSAEDNSVFLDLPFKKESTDYSSQQEILDIISFNRKSVPKHQSTMQFYERQDSDLFVFAKESYICIIDAEKGCDYNSVRITGQSILNIVDALNQEGSLEPDIIQWVIRESFGA
jgi:small GTP-binding protein